MVGVLDAVVASVAVVGVVDVVVVVFVPLLSFVSSSPSSFIIGISQTSIAPSSPLESRYFPEIGIAKSHTRAV